MSQPVAQIFRIGALTLDLGSGRLIGPKGDIDIRPKTFAMLVELVSRRGKIVSKDTLMEIVWPNVIVSEDSLTQCAYDLRRALGDDAALLRTYPRRGYMLEVSDAGPSPATETTTDVLPGSVALLPFGIPEGASERDRVMIDGLAYDMIAGLASMRSFQVTGRGSAFAVRDLADDPFRVRQLLRVSYVVTGRVVAGSLGYRLLLDVTRTDQGSLVWTGELPLDFSRLGTITREAIDRCVVAIASAVTLSETNRSAALGDKPLAAWEAYHRGLNHIFKFDPQSMSRALDYFKAAVSSDPGFVQAYAFQSFCHYYFAFAEIGADPGGSANAALATAERALEGDAASPAAHWAYGRALCLTGDPEGAMRHCEQAVQICPSFPHAHYMMGFLEANHGDAARALPHLDRSEALSPLDPFNASIQLTRAIVALRLGNLGAAADHAARVGRHRNVYAQMLFPAAAILMADGREEEGSALARRLRDDDPDYRADKFFRSLYGLSDDMRKVFEDAARRLDI